MSHILYRLVFILTFIIIGKTNKFSYKYTKVYGPGLSPDTIVLPVRYFFIDAHDVNRNKYNASIGDAFQVQIEGETTSGTYCRVWTQILDLYDGSYIVRYRTYQTCKDTSIYILHKGENVADSPYKIKDPLYSEDCYCPLKDIDTWLNATECPSSYTQIESDLKPFQNVNMDSVLEAVLKKFNQPASKSFCNYVVKDNKVYRKCYGQYVGFNMFMDNILHSLTRKMVLPDFEFIVNLGDWPLINKKSSALLPIFSWCGSDETADVVMPTYDLTEATLEMMGRVTLDILSVQAKNSIPWEEKQPRAFWRGRDSREERLELVTLSRDNPDLINASITNFFFFKDKIDVYGPKVPHESFFKFFDYKYQLNIDGTVASYRFPFLLAGTGVVFKQESHYYEFFYKDLEPFVHYIPFKRDLSDLVEKVNWALSNDAKAHQIGQTGKQFAQQNLLPQHVFCYHALLFKLWSTRIQSPIMVRRGMEHIALKDTAKRFGDCNCHRLELHDEL